MLGVKFKETAKMILTGLGLATIPRNKLKTSNPDVVCELVKVPAGVEIARSTSVSGGENARLNGAALGQSVVRVC
jgi:hypothetical protein